MQQNNVVSAAELDKKLCEVVIERQGGQIAELEAELRRANYKLHEKEAELEMLKNCVKRIGEFSLGNASGMPNFHSMKILKSNQNDLHVHVILKFVSELIFKCCR